MVPLKKKKKEEEENQAPDGKTLTNGPCLRPRSISAQQECQEIQRLNACRAHCDQNAILYTYVAWLSNEIVARCQKSYKDSRINVFQDKLSHIQIHMMVQMIAILTPTTGQHDCHAYVSYIA